MRRALRLAGLVSHPIQYQVPLFRCLSAHPDVDFTAIFLSEHGVRPSFDPGFGRVLAYDVPLLDGYRHVHVRNRARHPNTQRFFGAVNPGLAALLVRERFDALWVHGYAQASNWIGFVAAAATRLPLLIRGDSQLLVQPAPAVAGSGESPSPRYSGSPAACCTSARRIGVSMNASAPRDTSSSSRPTASTTRSSPNGRERRAWRDGARRFDNEWAPGRRTSCSSSSGN